MVFAVEAAFRPGSSQVVAPLNLISVPFFDKPDSLERFALCAGLIYDSLWP